MRMYRHMSERTVYPPSRAVFTESSATENHSSNTLPLHTPGAAIASVGKHLPITFLLCESKISRGGWRAPDMCSKENAGIVLKGKISFALAFVCVLLLVRLNCFGKSIDFNASHG
ncbi:hypothetical protein TNIN_9901 [Trichonephila inaurata madagascariensis]|uniref:Uncharacterized protein n=1 Tax=Trichonephila inaurata madagascariensis TaxID=2747483 RepID=A0A8X6XIZ9_9ARAC|nr:hypothetical protein TNIN_9901 [Trichonephila inaurata madagascariensis]